MKEIKKVKEYLRETLRRKLLEVADIVEDSDFNGEEVRGKQRVLNAC